ncbi:hypothetical protein E3U23_11145 [Erythrobacter litoralis]|uniref:hypothetical protein n=1 Tax=Erythrobacter litoralis TaxID=39960 RepID=UPI002434D3C0|nr:hypothetical protein [Erythrobacter litoralis]MDG6079744.1 hypothetical protein [Erythrobacter litoralis]
MSVVIRRDLRGTSVLLGEDTRLMARYLHEAKNTVSSAVAQVATVRDYATTASAKAEEAKTSAAASASARAGAETARTQAADAVANFDANTRAREQFAIFRNLWPDPELRKPGTVAKWLGGPLSTQVIDGVKAIKPGPIGTAIYARNFDIDVSALPYGRFSLGWTVMRKHPHDEPYSPMSGVYVRIAALDAGGQLIAGGLEADRAKADYSDPEGSRLWRALGENWIERPTRFKFEDIKLPAGAKSIRISLYGQNTDEDPKISYFTFRAGASAEYVEHYAEAEVAELRAVQEALQQAVSDLQTNTDSSAAQGPIAVNIYGSQSKFEGNDGPTAFTFDILLSRPALKAAQIPWLVTHVTTQDDDFIGPRSGVATIPIGTQRVAFDVEVLGERKIEGDEQFTVGFGAMPDGFAVGAASPTATATILGDDAQVLAGELSVGDGKLEGSTIRFPIARTGGTDGVVTAAWSLDFVGDATAEDLADDQSATGTIELADGQNAAVVSVAVNPEALGGSGAFHLTLRDPLGGVTIGDATGVYTFDTVAPDGSATNLSAPFIDGAPMTNTHIALVMGDWDGTIERFEAAIVTDTGEDVLTRRAAPNRTDFAIPDTVGSSLILKSWAIDAAGGETLAMSAPFGPIVPGHELIHAFAFCGSEEARLNLPDIPYPLVGIAGNTNTATYPQANPLHDDLFYGFDRAAAISTSDATLVDRRLAGRFGRNSTATNRIDLPGAGTYVIHAALGNGISNANLMVRDQTGAALHQFPSTAVPAPGHILDATGEVRSEAEWIALSPAGGEGIEVMVPEPAFVGDPVFLTIGQSEAATPNIIYVAVFRKVA